MAAELKAPEYHAPTVSDEELEQFRELGYLPLGRVAPPEVIDGLGERIDQIMMGEITIEDMMMSVCPSFSGGWDHEWTKQTKGFKTPCLAYRKICDLEQDDRYLAYLQLPLFRDIARKLIGDRVNLVRAMYFAKPAESGGVRIDWHQVRPFTPQRNAEQTSTLTNTRARAGRRHRERHHDLDGDR